MQKIVVGVFLSLSLILFDSCHSDKKEIALCPLNAELGLSDSVMTISSQLPELPVYTDQCKVIPIPSERGAMETADVLEKYEFIPLETTDECLISNINQIEVALNRIFVFDQKAKRLYSFTQDGKFVCQYGKEGRGPGEFLTPFDFTIDEKNQEVLLLDISYGKIIRYSLDGKHIGDIPMYYHFRHLKMTDGQLVLHVEHSRNSPNVPMYNYGITVSDKTMKPSALNFKISYDQEQFFMGSDHQHVVKMLDCLHVHFTLSDTIWMFRDNAWVAKYKLASPDGDVIPYSQWPLMTDKLYGELQKGKVNYLHSFAETEEFAVFNVWDENRSSWPLLYDKESGHIHYGYIGDMLKTTLPGSIIRPYYVYDHRSFIQPVSVSTLLNRFDVCREKGVPLTPQEHQLEKSIKEEDNPVLLKFTFKHF